MGYFTDSIVSAVHLAVSFDPEVISIVKVSISVASLSTFVAAVIGIPLGFLVAFNEFKIKRLLITFFNTLLALPTVTIGLLVYSIISRRGVLGPLNLLYSQKAIIIGQSILILPVIATFTISAISQIDSRYRRTAMTLGANQIQTAILILREARYAIIAALVAAFGRVISEVGISMMLGGNAKGFTRTITTAMALEYDKGEFVLSIALGLILLVISFTLNLLFHLLQGRGTK